MQKEYITNEAWIKILKFFEEHPEVYVGRPKNLKSFIEAVYWMARSGAPWRMLPEKYVKWNSVFIITPGQESDFSQANHMLGNTSGAYVLCLTFRRSFSKIHKYSQYRN